MHVSIKVYNLFQLVDKNFFVVSYVKNKAAFEGKILREENY